METAPKPFPIRFIAWSKTKNKMAHVKAVYWEKGLVVAALLDFTDHESVVSADLFNLLQSSGLRDKNKVEIYEGSIVKQLIPNEFGSYQESIGVMFRRNGQFIIEHKGLVLDIPEGADIPSPEVIGTIYQNPELLK